MMNEHIKVNIKITESHHRYGKYGLLGCKVFDFNSYLFVLN